MCTFCFLRHAVSLTWANLLLHLKYVVFLRPFVNRLLVNCCDTLFWEGGKCKKPHSREIGEGGRGRHTVPIQNKPVICILMRRNSLFKQTKMALFACSILHWKVLHRTISCIWSSDTYFSYRGGEDRIWQGRLKWNTNNGLQLSWGCHFFFYHLRGLSKHCEKLVALFPWEMPGQ